MRWIVMLIMRILRFLEIETQHTRKYRCAYCGNRYSVRPDPEDGEYCSSCHEKWDPVEDVEDVEAEKEHNI